MHAVEQAEAAERIIVKQMRLRRYCKCGGRPDRVSRTNPILNTKKGFTPVKRDMVEKTMDKKQIVQKIQELSNLADNYYCEFEKKEDCYISALTFGGTLGDIEVETTELIIVDDDRVVVVAKADAGLNDQNDMDYLIDLCNHYEDQFMFQYDSENKMIEAFCVWENEEFSEMVSDADDDLEEVIAELIFSDPAETLMKYYIVFMSVDKPFFSFEKAVKYILSRDSEELDENSDDLGDDE